MSILKPNLYIPPQITSEFDTIFSRYQKARDLLHQFEIAYQNPSIDLINSVLEAKEQIARYLLNVYEHSDDVYDYNKRISSIFDSSKKFSADIESEHHSLKEKPTSYPISFIHGLPSCSEAVFATVKNLGVIVEFSKCLDPTMVGLILNGSNSWGAFFAVKNYLNYTLLLAIAKRASRENWFRYRLVCNF